MTLGTASILRGDALNLALADGSVDLIVTSPPYFGLRSYQDGGEHYAGQIGAEPTPAEFVDALVAATAEMVRVLKPSGSIWVNLGDRYSGGNSGQSNLTKLGERLGTGGGQKQDSARMGTSAVAGMRPKSLIGIPWRYAIRCIDDLGLILRAEVIWSKPNGLPESVTDRVRRSHETWFHFTKEPRYFSAVDEIREAHAEVSLKRAMPHRATSGLMHGTHPGGGEKHMDMTKACNPLGKLPGSVWTIPTQPLKVPADLGIDHFAAFPMEWPRRIIRGWSPSGICTVCGEGRRPVSESRIIADRGGRQFNPATGNVGVLGKEREYRITGEACACTPDGLHMACGSTIANPSHSSHEYGYPLRLWCPGSGGTVVGVPQTLPPTRPSVVLDPFGGTGTTALVAKALGRHGITNDMSADYCRLAQWRTNDPGELARAMQVDKPAEQIKGQADLFDLFDGEAS